MVTPEQIKELDDLQASFNNGRGISAVQTILIYLRDGNEEKARRVREIEGDKTCSYPEVEKLLTKMFGCRTHGNQNCTKWPCNPMGEL